MRAIGFKNNKFNIDEPFESLFTQGMVCHETFKDENNNWVSPEEIDTKDSKNYFLKTDISKKIIVGPSESMSKSKKNTIDPEEIIKNYGADAVRLFILSDSPPEKDVQWSEQGMVASYKFIQKLWTLHNKIKIKLDENNESTKNEIPNQINEFVNKVDIVTIGQYLSPGPKHLPVNRFVSPEKFDHFRIFRFSTFDSDVRLRLSISDSRFSIFDFRFPNPDSRLATLGFPVQF